MMKKIVSLLLALTLVFALAACGGSKEKTPEQDPKPVETDDPQETPEPVETADPVDVNLYVLAGPTGIGAVNLRAKAEAGETLSNNYHVTRKSLETL